MSYIPQQIGWSQESKLLWELLKKVDRLNGIAAANSGSETNPTNIVFAPSTAQDAFGRLRVSEPFTMFDSSHRYADNNLWATKTATGGTTTFNQDEGLIDLKVTAANGSSVLRETTKVFSYQPGKSLLVLNTFIMSPAKTGLRQRVGYYGADNGMFLQLQDSTLSFVERSIVTGSLTETYISQFGGVYGAGDTGWNVDKMDGTGPSKITLDITKAQIFFMDVEWLGLGTVRLGFVINGVFYVCHTFDHANIITSTYITTASLPLRYEITNTSATSGASTLKQVCSTVISEGGYELRGLQQAVQIPVNAPVTFITANVYLPIISIRLKSTRLDAIVILSAISMVGLGNGKNYAWQVVGNAITTGGTWIDAGASSAVEYNITGTSSAGSRILSSGFVNSSNQGSPSVNLLKEALFANQLERDAINSPTVAYEISLLVAVSDASGTNGILASMDWEEVSR